MINFWSTTKTDQRNSKSLTTKDSNLYYISNFDFFKSEFYAIFLKKFEIFGTVAADIDVFGMIQQCWEPGSVVGN